MEGIKTENGVLWNGHVCPALCLDLDGTIRYSKSGTFINGPDDVALFQDVEAKLWEYRNNGYLILGVSNQGGVAHGHKTAQMCEEELDMTLALFRSHPFHMVKMCYHEAAGGVFPYNRRSLLRKPDIGMLALMEGEAFDGGYLIDWDKSLMVGDRPEDQLLAVNTGMAFQWADDFFGRVER